MTGSCTIVVQCTGVVPMTIICVDFRWPAIRRLIPNRDHRADIAGCLKGASK
jgi:hypothetical protein